MERISVYLLNYLARSSRSGLLHHHYHGSNPLLLLQHHPVASSAASAFGSRMGRRRPRREISSFCSSSITPPPSTSTPSKGAEDKEDDATRKIMEIRQILHQVAKGTMSIEGAEERLKATQSGYDSVNGYAKIDYAREARTGLPEVIYGEGKTAGQLIAILLSMAERRSLEQQATTALGHGVILASRVSEEKYQRILTHHADDVAQLESHGSILEYLGIPRLLVLKQKDKEGSSSAATPSSRRRESIGQIAVMCAGTADLSVAEEAAVIAELCGAEVHRIYDVGIAGIHRLFRSLDTIRHVQVAICVAGMDGALPTVVAGLVPCPVIAVPTSVGYGIGANGLAPLMTMLTACAPGVAVVNIDNGLGGAAMAIKMLRHLSIPSSFRGR